MCRNRRNFALVGMTMVLSFLFAACGRAGGSAQTEVSPVTLRWVTGESSNKAENELIRQFQAEYPQIRFERSASFDSLEGSIADVPQPDLINADVTWDLARIAGSGKLADLTELWEESGLTENVPAALQAMSEVEGRQFYIPVAVGWKAIYVGLLRTRPQRCGERGVVGLPAFSVDLAQSGG